MLSGIAGSLLIMLQLTGAQPPPGGPDWRSEFTKRPLTETRTISWSCKVNDKPSFARVRVTDTGGKYRNAFFKIELIDLKVAGAAASKRALDAVRASLGAINNLHQLSGWCRVDSPVLKVEGAYYDGRRDDRKSFTIDLE